MSRIPELNREALNDASRRTYDEILAARGSIAGPFRVWLHSPEFTRRATQLGEYLRYHTGLPPRLSELVILLTARACKSEAEWTIHEPLARKAGLSDGVIDALHRDETPDFASDGEQAVYEYCVQLLHTRTVEESILQRLVDRFDAKTAVDITGLCGYYTLVAMTLNAFDVSAENTSTP